MSCINCKSKIEDGEKFCTSCGQTTIGGINIKKVKYLEKKDIAILVIFLLLFPLFFMQGLNPNSDSQGVGLIWLIIIFFIFRSYREKIKNTYNQKNKRYYFFIIFGIPLIFIFWIF